MNVQWKKSDLGAPRMAANVRPLSPRPDMVRVKVTARLPDDPMGKMAKFPLTSEGMIPKGAVEVLHAALLDLNSAVQTNLNSISVGVEYGSGGGLFGHSISAYRAMDLDQLSSVVTRSGLPSFSNRVFPLPQVPDLRPRGSRSLYGAPEGDVGLSPPFVRRCPPGATWDPVAQQCVRARRIASIYGVGGVRWLPRTLAGGPEYTNAMNSAAGHINQAGALAQDAVKSAESAYRAASECVAGDDSPQQLIDQAESMISSAQGHINSAGQNLSTAGSRVENDDEGARVSQAANTLNNMAAYVSARTSEVQTFVAQADIAKDKCTSSPCPGGQVRNPDTGICESVPGTSRCPPGRVAVPPFGCKPICPPNQARNQKTGDCGPAPCGAGSQEVKLPTLYSSEGNAYQPEAGAKGNCVPVCNKDTEDYDPVTNKCVPKATPVPVTPVSTAGGGGGGGIWIAIMAALVLVAGGIAMSGRGGTAPAAA